MGGPTRSNLRAAIVRSIVRALTCALAAAVIYPAATRAQSAPTPAPSQPLSFAVVSIKPYSPSDGSHGLCVRHEDPEMYSVEACDLYGLTLDALEMQSDEYALVDQAPAWTNSFSPSALFSLTAHTNAPTTHAERMEMLKNALITRFGLVLRKAMVDRKVYWLEPFGRRPRLQPAADPHSSQCGLVWRPGSIQSPCATIHDLTQLLAGSLLFNAPVIDHTGLPAAAKYNIVIQLDRKLMPSSPLTTKLSEVDQALQDQSGLRLRTAHVVMPEIVIVAARRPTSN